MRTWRSEVLAVSAGSSFPTAPFTFVTHSVFPGAMNLKPLDPEGGGYLVSLVDDERKAHPRAAVVPGTRFDVWGPAPGETGFFDGAALRFGTSGSRALLPAARRPRATERPAVNGAARDAALGAGFHGSVDAAAAEARAVRCRLSAAAAAVGALRSARGCSPGADVLLNGAACRDAYEKRFREGAFGLEAAVSTRSSPEFLGAARRLIGLGPGLTPAGDDFLCGYLAGLRSRAAPGSGLEAFLDALGAALGAILGAPPADAAAGIAAPTNEVSAAFLAEAAAGRFGAALVSFADAVGGIGPRAAVGDGWFDAAAASTDVEEAVRSIASIGSGSGLDAALGFLFAFRDGLVKIETEK